MHLHSTAPNRWGGIPYPNSPPQLVIYFLVVLWDAANAAPSDCQCHNTLTIQLHSLPPYPTPFPAPLSADAAKDLLFNTIASNLLPVFRSIGLSVKHHTDNLTPLPAPLSADAAKALHLNTIVSNLLPTSLADENPILFNTIVSSLLSSDLHNSISSSLKTLSKRLSPQLTIIIHEFDGYTDNYLFQAVNLFLGTKLTPPIDRIKVTKPDKGDPITVTLDRNQPITDVFQNIKCKWVLHTQHVNAKSNSQSDLEYFELTFNKKYKDTILTKYLPHVVKQAKEINKVKKKVKLHTLPYSGATYWTSVTLNHPATFETLAMDEDKKAEIIEDINLFVKRKEFYRKVGKTWKRGYLLYGPPGTGKSSLIGAMANYLNFNVYDLDLSYVHCNSDLRRLLTGTKNRSIIVFEDIDCNVEVQSREAEKDEKKKKNANDKLTLSGLLNFIDGLWTGGDERIIVFTTNHKERLDAALLRPGRMDVHIKMSYCTYGGFKVLASNYLEVKEDQQLRMFEEVKEALTKVKVTPAEVAGELMKGENVEIVLQNLIQWLQMKAE